MAGDHVTKEITKAIDEWSMARGMGRRPEHAELAVFVAKRIGGLLSPRCSVVQSLLLDIDPSDPGRYVNPRLVDSGCSPEEDLWPEDPETGWPVENALADVVWYLPCPDAVPEL